MKKIISIIFGFVFVTFLFTFVAAKPITVREMQNAQTGENITFAECINGAVIMKNTCYETSKASRETCRADAKVENASKTDKLCNQDYKSTMKQCKTTFRYNKTDCKKIKHNIFESIGAAFK